MATKPTKYDNDDDDDDGDDDWYLSFNQKAVYVNFCIWLLLFSEEIPLSHISQKGGHFLI